MKNKEIIKKIDKDKIILPKHEQGCVFCGSIEEVQKYKGKDICKKCMIDITNMTLLNIEKNYNSGNDKLNTV